MNYPRYPKYKDSGVEWLGEIPEEWDAVYAKRLFTNKRVPQQENDDQLTASQKHGVIPQKMFMEKADQKVALALNGTDNFKHVDIDDFVISLRSFEGGIERAYFSGCITPAYTVLSLQKNNFPSFWAYLMKSYAFILMLSTLSESLRDGKAINYESFGKALLPIPPLETQKAIASYLDTETVKIDGLIKDYEELIELLQEKRQALISHAVTRGLSELVDPDDPKFGEWLKPVTFKDSGVEWIGGIPEGWEAKKLRYLLKRNGLIRGPFGGDLKKEIFTSSGYKVYEQKNAIYANIELGDSFIDQAKYDDMSRFQVYPGDFIMSCSGTVGKLFEIPPNAPQGIINQALLIMRLNDSVFSQFFTWIFNADFLENQILDNSQGGAMKNLVGMDIFTAISFPLPKLFEQQAIASFLDRETAKIDILVSETQGSIELLKEHRSALITNAVTGKINVEGIGSAR